MVLNGSSVSFQDAGNTQDALSISALGFDGQHFPGQYVTSSEFGMFCTTILFIFMLHFETGSVAGCFSEQFVARALEHLAVLETLKPLFINAAVVIHDVQVIGETIEGGERTGEKPTRLPSGCAGWAFI